MKQRTPEQTIIATDKKITKLRNKREKVESTSCDDKKIFKINMKIHREKVKQDIAKEQLKGPKKTTNNITTNVSFNKNDNSKSVQFHGHYHNNKKKK